MCLLLGISWVTGCYPQLIPTLTLTFWVFGSVVSRICSAHSEWRFDLKLANFEETFEMCVPWGSLDEEFDWLYQMKWLTELSEAITDASSSWSHHPFLAELHWSQQTLEALLQSHQMFHLCKAVEFEFKIWCHKWAKLEFNWITMGFIFSLPLSVLFPSIPEFSLFGPTFVTPFHPIWCQTISEL